jgi:hypothetical protein
MINYSPPKLSQTNVYLEFGFLLSWLELVYSNILQMSVHEMPLQVTRGLAAFLPVDLYRLTLVHHVERQLINIVRYIGTSNITTQHELQGSGDQVIPDGDVQ